MGEERSELLCSRIEDHAASPEGYIAWHAWAAQMSKTHRQVKCTGCGRYAIWQPKRPTPPKETPDDQA